MEKFVCIHGHFYQPPREDPWTRRVPVEPSASPFHDWNERIASECYSPNAASPVLDGGGRITETLNNFGHISYDFGPTLLRWIESHEPALYGLILEGDRQSVKRFGGHGAAMAQVFNHMIMPLADNVERRRQVRWAVDDFERRFGRHPEGIWLPETAVDLDTLEALAAFDLRFTVLSPDQAAATRGKGNSDWTDVSSGTIDTKRAYRCLLPSGKTMALFFYDKGLSTGLAFGGTLDTVANFTGAILGSFAPSGRPQLVSLATDGETFGHHHKNGNSVLSGGIERFRREGSPLVTSFGQFLSLFPPSAEVRIKERTSWSCPHGVERWRSNCGCASEIRPGYNQKWRKPLRASMDWLKGKLDRVYEEHAPGVFSDPGEAADGLAAIPFERHDDLQVYAARHTKPGAPFGGRSQGTDLLEMVECSSLMFASCAWFWEDIARIEPVQALRYASRAMELAREVDGTDLEPEFKSMLSLAKPNDPTFRTGSDLYEAKTRPKLPGRTPLP